MNLRVLLCAALIAAAVCCVRPAARLEAAPVTHSDTVESYGVISAVDPSTRVVTVAYANGSTDTFTIWPDFPHFDALVVGARVHIKLTSSTIYSIAKPGAPPPSGQSMQVAAKGVGGTVTNSKTRTVTVQAVDRSGQQITVLTDSGPKTYPVLDGKALNGVSAGDKIAITQLDTAVFSVSPPPKK